MIVAEDQLAASRPRMRPTSPPATMALTEPDDQQPITLPADAISPTRAPVRWRLSVLVLVTFAFGSPTRSTVPLTVVNSPRLPEAADSVRWRML